MGKKRKQFAVFGLGEFGKSVALALMEYGCEVLAVDFDEEKVQKIADSVSYAVTADVTAPGIMEELGVRNLDAVVVGIGTNLEASILCTIAAKEVQVPYILAKSQSDLHAAVLRKVGADEIVFPERSMGIRTASNLVSGNFVDIVELTDDFSIVEICVPKHWAGKTLAQLHLREMGINVLARKEGESLDTRLNPNQKLELHETYVVLGENQFLNELDV